MALRLNRSDLAFFVAGCNNKGLAPLGTRFFGIVELVCSPSRLSSPMCRRFHLRFSSAVGALILGVLMTAIPGHCSNSNLQTPREYRLRFYHTHTNERLEVIYRRGDTYLPAALARLDYFLRDHRTGDVHHFDPRLFDLLHDLTESLKDTGGEIDVICGYRTPWSNEFLRTRSAHTGVAVHSLHMQGRGNRHSPARGPDLPTTRCGAAAATRGSGILLSL